MLVNEKLFLDGYELPEPLEKKEKEELFKRVVKGDKDAKNKIVTHNLKLVASRIVRRFAHTGHDPKDLMSVGIVGLMNAVDKYDFTRGIEFSTYAACSIDYTIIRYIESNNEYLQVSSLDSTMPSDMCDEEFNLLELLESEENTESDYMKKQTYHKMFELLDELPERDRQILKLHFGLVEDRQYTQIELSKMFNTSRSNIAMMIDKNLKWLAYKLREEGYAELNEKRNRAVDKINPDIIGTKIQGASTIYEFFYKDGFERQEVIDVLEELTEDEKKLIEKKYGNDLDVLVTSRWLDTKTNNAYYNKLVPKMKQMMLSKKIN